MGSACEVEYHLLLARDLQYLCESDYDRIAKDVIEVKRMLAALQKKLRSNLKSKDPISHSEN
jgi:four helix bundle protein